MNPPAGYNVPGPHAPRGHATPELTLESLATRVAELERKAAAWEAVERARRRVAELTDVPELADNPMREAFQQAMRDNRERMDREDAARLAVEDAGRV